MSKLINMQDLFLTFTVFIGDGDEAEKIVMRESIRIYLTSTCLFVFNTD